MKIKIGYHTFFKETTNIGEEIIELEDIEHSLDEVADIISSKYGSKFRKSNHNRLSNCTSII